MKECFPGVDSGERFRQTCELVCFISCSYNTIQKCGTRHHNEGNPENRAPPEQSKALCLSSFGAQLF